MNNLMTESRGKELVTQVQGIEFKSLETAGTPGVQGDLPVIT